MKAANLFFILYSRGSGKGSLRGLVNSSTKDVLLATDWWVRVRGGEGLSCPPLIGSLSFFLSSGGDFTQNGGAILKWRRSGFTFHIATYFSGSLFPQYSVYSSNIVLITMHYSLSTYFLSFLQFLEVKNSIALLYQAYDKFLFFLPCWVACGILAP